MRRLINPILLALAVLLLSCAFAQQRPDKNTLVIAQPAPNTTLDPAAVSSRATANIAQNIFTTLLQVTPEGEIVPYLAKSYSFSEDGKAITFKLHKGLTCEDGEPLTAEDVAYSFQRAANPKNDFVGNTPGFVLPTIGYAGVKVDDPLTVTIMTKTYQPIAPGMLAQVYIHCKDSYEKMTLEQASQHPVASGPYKLLEWVKDDHITLERRDNFKLRHGNFKYIVFRIIPEASTRAAELIAGNVDIAANISPDQQDAIGNSGVAKVTTIRSLRHMYVGFNFKDKFAKASKGGAAIQKQAVRQALQYAIDVPTICKALLNTPCKRAVTLVYPPNGNPNLKPYPYDPEKAEKMLDAAGYPRGKDGVRFSLTLQAPSGHYVRGAVVAQAIGQYFSEIGVKTDVQILNWSVYVPLLNQHDLGPLYFLGTGASTWSAVYDMANITSPDSGPNYGNWSNPEWFKLWDKLSTTRDPADQRKIINHMLKIFYTDSPWIMLYWQPSFWGISNRIDWQPRRDQEIWAAEISLK